ncbi:transglycosylase domain-containing protein, partial [Streptomyces exfoliatus]
AYGVEAASQRYFSKHAKDLKLEEAAMLAGLVQSPTRYDPVNDTEEATKRRNTVLRRMADVGSVSKDEAAKAIESPLKLKVKRPRNGCITAVSGSGFFCDYVRKTILTDPAFGKTAEDRTKLWNLGGLTVKTTLSPRAQKAANEAA